MTIYAPGIIVHASGSRGNMPDPGKRAYRLHCRFQIGAYPSARQLELAKYKWAEQFVVDMAKKGYQHIGESSRLPPEQRGWRLTFKGAHIAPMNLVKPPRVLSSREMLPQVMQGARFRAEEEPPVMLVPHYSETEYWDYDLSTIFIRDTILMDQPDLHEERRPA